MRQTPSFYSIGSFYGLLCILLFLANALQAQAPGDLFLQHYKIPLPSIDNHNTAVVQGKNSILYFANTKGVLTYDGVNWGIIATQTTPYSLAIHPKSGKIYVGCRENFGYLEVDYLGRETFKPLQKPNNEQKALQNLAKQQSKSFGKITRIIIQGDVGFFYSEQAIFEVDLNKDQIVKTWRPQEEQRFAGFFLHRKQLYANIAAVGLHLLKPNGFELIENGDYFREMVVQSSFDYDAENVMFTADNSWHYLFDGKDFSLFYLVAGEYLRGSQLSFAQNLNDKLFITATLTGGCIIVEKKTGITHKIINFQTGLPDDEIYGMTLDKLGSLWICHAKGISRADLNLPIKTYSTYAGLDGTVTTALSLNDTLLVGTTRGLFLLNKVSQYEEVQSYIKKESRFLQKIQTITKVVKINEPTEETESKYYKHSLENNLARQAKRKITFKETVETSEATQVSKAEEVKKYSTIDVRKAYAMTSIPFVFKGVAGVEGKVKQLLRWRDAILVATNTGLFQVIFTKDGATAVPILPDKAIQIIVGAKAPLDQLWVGTSTGFYAFSYVGKNGWQPVALPEPINEPVYSILPVEKALWLGSENQVFRLATDSVGKWNNPEKYAFSESYSETLPVRWINQQVMVFFSSGVMKYQPDQKNFVPLQDKNLTYNAQSQIRFAQSDYTWIKSKGKWNNLARNAPQDTIRGVYLELFDQVDDLIVDEKENLWIVNNGELHKLEGDATQNPQNLKEYEKNFQIFIRNITNKQGSYIPLKDSLILDYGSNYLSFNFLLASPFYQNEQATEYQYWLEGLYQTNKNQWSNWTKQAVISFPYLPSGSYRLHLRAKNIFGQTSQERTFHFTIKPPFWETMWFYLLQVGFFLGLLFLSFFFSRRGKYSKISFILTFITVISFFEFLAWLIEPYVENAANGVAIFKLGMNILLALSLSPIEQILRRLLGSSESYTTVTKKTTETAPKTAQTGKREGAN